MYFGSIRFFKNMILLAVIIMITLPTVFAFKYKSETVKLKKTATTVATKEAKEAEKNKNKKIKNAPPEYQNLYPDFYAPKEYAATKYKENLVYLTFDDGPSERTDEILSILERTGAKATFFAIGKTDDLSLQRMKNVVNGGHTLGMHSYSHNYEQIYSSVEAYLEDMYQIFTLIKNTTGFTPSVFRFPGGSINGYNGGIYKEIISEMIRRGFVPYDWNISSQDATSSKLDADEIVDNVLRGIEGKRRGIVLFHDAAPKTTSVEALPAIIDGVRSRGYELAALTPDIEPTLFGYNN